MLTTKKLPLKSIVHELLWFLAGDTNIKYLKDNGVSIWDEWADANGDLGPVYGRSGAPGRRRTAQHRPDRQRGRHDPAQSGFAAADRQRVESGRCRQDGAAAVPLPVPVLRRGGKLSCQLYQRSADVFLGVPFNIASYALLTMMVAQVTGLKPGDFVHTLRRRASLFEPPRAGAAATDAPDAAAAGDEDQSRREGHLRLPLRGLRARRLRPAPAHQGRGRGVTATNKAEAC
jgi:hypothetical protein